MLIEAFLPPSTRTAPRGLPAGRPAADSPRDPSEGDSNLDGWASVLNVLRAEFVGRAEQRLEGAHQLIERLAQAAADRRALGDLLRVFHSLAGKGGFFGFWQLIEAGQRGEESCAALLERDADPGPADLAVWRELALQVGIALMVGPGEPPSNAWEDAALTAPEEDRFEESRAA